MAHEEIIGLDVSEYGRIDGIRYKSIYTDGEIRDRALLSVHIDIVSQV